MGPYGGYLLARPAKEITLLEVMEAVEGPFVGSVQWEQGNGTYLDAALRSLMTSVGEAVRDQLAGVSVADLAETDRKVPHARSRRPR
jgi:DNA-binding IscR family transcriptional regulator